MKKQFYLITPAGIGKNPDVRRLFHLKPEDAPRDLSLRCKEGCSGETEDCGQASDKEGLRVWNILQLNFGISYILTLEYPNSTI